MKSTGIGILLVVLVLVIVYVTGAVMAQMPDHVQVDADSAFVYPVDGGQGVALVLPQGEFYVTGSVIVDGCYLLRPAEKGASRGTAELVWPFCDTR